MTACRYCGAEIFWAKSRTTEKPAPIDDVASDEGNIRIDLDAETYDVLAGARLEAARSAGEKLHTNHFATCTNPPKRRPR